MSPTQDVHSWEREERHIARDRERIAELKRILARFHAAVGRDVPLWRHAPDADATLGAATELVDVNHELCLLYLQRLQRGEVVRHQGHEDAAPALSPDQERMARVTEAWEQIDHELDRLRTMRAGEEVVRRAERDRRARLLWLIDLLETVMPDHARRMRKDVLEPDAAHLGVPANARFRRERQLGDKLVLFLGPLL